MYVAPGGGPLYIFLEQTTPITDEVFEAKAHEYMERVSPTAHRYTDQCGGHTGDERKDCFNSFLDHPKWRDFESHLHFSRAVPRSNIYERIVIDVGGSDGRRKVPGWASWRQVWPPVAPGPGGSSGFDVSDVDLTNIPNPDCEDIVSDLIRRACHAWQYHPGQSHLELVGAPSIVTPAKAGVQRGSWEALPKLALSEMRLPCWLAERPLTTLRRVLMDQGRRSFLCASVRTQLCGS